jgi:hypothetical protein
VQDRWRATAVQVGAVAGLGVLLAVLGPFGTFSIAPAAERLVYWVGVLLLGYIVYWPACLHADAAARRLGRSPFVARLAATALATAPLTLLVWLASYRHTPSLWPTPAAYLAFYPSVLVIGAVLTALLWALERRLRPAAAAPSPAPPDAGSRFLQKLPPHLGCELLALQMEDHYVRAHTARGSDLVLMRMRDAVEALAGVDGLRVHRSWWVARAAVAGVERQDRSLRLVLQNGLKVPIPRERIADLREAGWIVGRPRGSR